MQKLIIKYSILLVVAMVLSHLLSGVILIIWPDFLTSVKPDGGTSTLGVGYLTSALSYLINIVFVVLLMKEMNKENIKSIPLLILTFFSSFLGVVIFLFIVAYQKLNPITTNTYE